MAPRTTAPSPAAPRTRRRRSPALAPATPWTTRVLGSVRALPDHVLLDRIIRGRVWIPLLGVLLAGIVAMQVEVLKLNAATAQSLQTSTTLQNERDGLQANVARLSDDQRIESLAAQMGMVMPAPALVKFLSPGTGNTSSALGNIHQSDATTFDSQLLAEQTEIADAAAAAGATQADTGTASSPTAAPSTAAAGVPSTDASPEAPAGSSTDTSSTGTDPTDTGGDPSDTGSDTGATAPTTPAYAAPTTPSTGTDTGSTAPPAQTTAPAAAPVTGSSQTGSTGGVGATPVGG